MKKQNLKTLDLRGFPVRGGGAQLSREPYT